MKHWRSPYTIPRDGSWVIILYDDFSSTHMISYYAPCEQWIEPDGSLWINELEEKLSIAGWIPAPKDTPKYTTTPVHGKTRADGE
jgi:hypothetical protein